MLLCNNVADVLRLCFIPKLPLVISSTFTKNVTEIFSFRARCWCRVSNVNFTVPRVIQCKSSLTLTTETERKANSHLVEKATNLLLLDSSDAPSSVQRLENPSERTLSNTKAQQE